MKMYKLRNDDKGNLIAIETTFGDIGQKSIPINLANMDYQDYLRWVAEGNTPLPADE